MESFGSLDRTLCMLKIPLFYAYLDELKTILAGKNGAKVNDALKCGFLAITLNLQENHLYRTRPLSWESTDADAWCMSSPVLLYTHSIHRLFYDSL